MLYTGTKINSVSNDLCCQVNVLKDQKKTQN